jgi:hypothetical protein
MSVRTHSFVWGGLSAAALVAVGIYLSVSSNDFMNLLIFGVLAAAAFTLVSCLILDNNFVGEMISGIFSWGFVSMPGVIFTLDLDGIIWLLTVKLLFWILGIILAVICGVLGIAIGLFVSIFVYPFALYKNIKYGEDEP